MPAKVENIATEETFSTCSLSLFAEATSEKIEYIGSATPAPPEDNSR